MTRVSHKAGEGDRGASSRRVVGSHQSAGQAEEGEAVGREATMRPSKPESVGAASQCQAFCNRLATTVIGQWPSDNGIAELRLKADILVDPRQALAAIGQPV